MAVADTDCIPCPNGKFCDTSGLSDLSSKDCEQGYYCQTSAVNARQNACDYDEKCVTGTLHPEKCAPSEYTPTSKAWACLTCDAGKRCVGGSVTDCEAGTWCSGNTVEYCAPGKYGQSTDIGKSSSGTACTDCEIGYACQQPNSRLGCAAGWFCGEGGAESRKPNSKTNDKGEICSPGEICTMGTTSKTPCSPGYFCPNWGASASEGLCYAGYYCSGGSK